MFGHLAYFSFVKVKDKHLDIPLVVGCSIAQPPLVLADGTKCKLKLHRGFILVWWEVELRPPALCV